MPTPMVVAIVVGALWTLILLGVIIAFFKTWIRAQAAGAPVSFGVLIGMRLRKVPAGRVVDARITMHQAGVDEVTYEKLERLHLAGGNVTKVGRALAAARAANIDLTFEHAAAIDLAGRDVVAEVRQAAEGAPAPGA
ncbi:MAG TPA: flotillin-like FloA family protein [Vicinamibacterales bacterium]|nr:flotillin-like FloA family protein [Vicinamibacterales bacterium]